MKEYALQFYNVNEVQMPRDGSNVLVVYDFGIMECKIYNQKFVSRQDWNSIVPEVSMFAYMPTKEELK